MQIKVIFIVLAGLILLSAHPEAYAETTDPLEFLYSNEFKDAEVARLLALPPDVVLLMSNRLEGMDDRDQRRHRLVSSLFRKLSQANLNLTLEVRRKALAALKRKFSSVNKAKQDLILMIESDMTGSNSDLPPDKPDKQHLAGNSYKDLDLTQIENSNAAPNTPSQGQYSSTPWSIIVVLIVAGCGLLWFMFKRRS